MTAKIFTLPARDVVPGMIDAECPDGIHYVTSVRVIAPSDGWVRIETEAGAATFEGPGDASFLVRLPGPSPRELLCSCPDGPHDPAQPWSLHWPSCPVRRLRLRLWPAPTPAGSPWTWVDNRLRGWRVVGDAELGTAIYMLEAIALIDDPERWRGREHQASIVRAAFCEPEIP